mmetsp:Transcript_11270/g.21435  ORF Transcript_11270/g.21435 Transcript_11270/m.21435 type:complete len:119 (-) Transcript_11270:45-401(-)
MITKDGAKKQTIMSNRRKVLLRCHGTEERSATVVWTGVDISGTRLSCRGKIKVKPISMLQLLLEPIGKKEKKDDNLERDLRVFPFAPSFVYYLNCVFLRNYAGSSLWKAFLGLYLRKL